MPIDYYRSSGPSCLFTVNFSTSRTQGVLGCPSALVWYTADRIPWYCGTGSVIPLALWDPTFAFRLCAGGYIHDEKQNEATNQKRKHTTPQTDLTHKNPSKPTRPWISFLTQLSFRGTINRVAQMTHSATSNLREGGKAYTYVFWLVMRWGWPATWTEARTPWPQQRYTVT